MAGIIFLIFSRIAGPRVHSWVIYIRQRLFLCAEFICDTLYWQKWKANPLFIFMFGIHIRIIFLFVSFFSPFKSQQDIWYLCFLQQHLYQELSRLYASPFQLFIHFIVAICARIKSNCTLHNSNVSYMIPYKKNGLCPAIDRGSREFRKIKINNCKLRYFRFK